MSKQAGYGAVLVRVGQPSSPSYFNSIEEAEAAAVARAKGGQGDYVVYVPSKSFVSSVRETKLCESTCN